MKTEGWKPEPFEREKLTLADVDRLLNEVRTRAETHFAEYGDGIFMHPHEIVGCMFGQQIKLSTAADASIYSGDMKEFRERCMKTFMAMVIGTLSVDKLVELRTEK
jgi:hypothetical protein